MEIMIVLFIIAAAVLFIKSMIWAYYDAESRGKYGMMIVFWIFVCCWPISLLFWICARPEKKKKFNITL